MLDRESACNRVFLARRFVLFGADGVWLGLEPARSFSSWPLPRDRQCRVTAALLPHQPDQLRRRDDRYDNGERATPLDASRLTTRAHCLACWIILLCFPTLRRLRI